jgi:3-ketosteroid 9alpha-monooxygenase subunit A
MEYGGWMQLAYERNLCEGLNSIAIEDRKLLCIKRGTEIEVYDGVCLHRGADLGAVGTLDDHSIVCRFHGYRMNLRRENGGPFCLRRYPSFAIGGIVFALVDGIDTGFSDFVTALAKDHKFFAGFERTIKVAPQMVIENAFDPSHLRPVHDVVEVEAKKTVLEGEILRADTLIRVGTSAWQGDSGGAELVEVPIVFRAFSPYVVVARIAVGGGDKPHFTFATAMPLPGGSSAMRLSVALPRLDDGSEPSENVAEILLQFERMGVEQDSVIWESLSDITPQYLPGDATVIEYRKWCDRFRMDRKPSARGHQAESPHMVRKLKSA